MELADVRWDSTSHLLTGTLFGPEGSDHNIIIYVPREYRWDVKRPDYFQEAGQYSLTKVDIDILRLRARFGPDSRTTSQVHFAPVP